MSADDAVKRRIVEESFDATLGARPLKRYLEEKVGKVLSEAIIRGPQALMRLFQLYTREGHFEVQADALVPREPVATGFALEPLLTLPVEKLREKVLELREEVQRIRHSDTLGALSEQVRFHLARLQAGEGEHAESLYTLDAMRLYLDDFTSRLEALARAPEEEAREMIEVERFGILSHPSNAEKGVAGNIRLFDRRAFEPVRVVSREQMLDALAEVFFLRRILRDVSAPVSTSSPWSCSRSGRDGRMASPAPRSPSGSAMPTSPRAASWRASPPASPMAPSSREAPWSCLSSSRRPWSPSTSRSSWWAPACAPSSRARPGSTSGSPLDACRRSSRCACTT